MQKEAALGFKKLAVTALGLVLGLAIGTGAMAQDLIKFEIKDGESIVKSLTGKKGDAKKGRATAINRKKGNCLACHVMPIPEQAFHGKLGPDLNGVADRYSEGEIRLRIVNPKVFN
jgi:sulfur-oxidizing protein SoxX